MIYLVFALIALGVITAILNVVYKDKDESVKTISNSCGICNGDNNKCEQKCMMEVATKAIEYYDDEELDVFQGRQADLYTDEEVGMFCEVLYTMRQEDVKGWNRSLILRGINLPNQIKDEVIMMMEN